MSEGDAFPPFRERIPGRGAPVPRPNWRLIVAIVVGFFAILATWSSAFTVRANEEGVVLRFGAYNRTATPGLNWKFPFPIESVQLVPVQDVLKSEYGFSTERAGVVTRYSTRDFSHISLMLCGDRNVADVEWVAQYRIKDSRQYLFNVRNVGATFDNLNESVMREVVGDRSVMEVLTTGRDEIAFEVRNKLQELCDVYEMGIDVVQILLQDVEPPDPVKGSFNEVNKAQQEREQKRNEAETEYKNVIPKSRGEAEQTVAEAEGYAMDRVNRAKGDVAAFKALLAAYLEQPDVTRTRLYLETLGTIYPKVKRKIVVDSELQGLLPLLDLGKEAGR
ncbi:MAG: FtsH protease activity modulator HflK [Planctomycetes bacterium]|nr:FtsH protease activity modulator HflK [Planctomycetota bacterium]